MRPVGEADSQPRKPLDAGDLASPPPPCSECGTAPLRDDRGHLPWRRVKGWSPLRLLPTALVLLAVAALLRYGGDSSTSRRIDTAIPSIITPPVTADEIAAVAEGRASQELESRWHAAMVAIVEDADAVPERSAFVCVGVIAPPPRIRQDWRFGWPSPWAWAVRSVERDDSVLALESEVEGPDDVPFQYLPKIPTQRLQVLGSSLLPWTYLLASDGTNEWRLDPSSIRWEEGRPRRAAPAPPRVAERTAALLIGNWSVPIIAAWLLWKALRLVPALRPKRWRVACLALSALLAAPFLSEVRSFLDRGWVGATAPKVGWEEAPFLPPFTESGVAPRGPWLHREEIRAALATPASRRSFAAFIEPTTTELGWGSKPRYLVAGANGPWPRETRSWRSVAIDGLWWSRSTSADMPTELTSLDPGAGPTLRCRDGVLDLRWRAAAPAAPSYRLHVALGPLGWLLIALALAWSIPAALVEAFRRRRARRRYAAGLCPVCSHPLALAPPTPVRSSV